MAASRTAISDFPTDTLKWMKKNAKPRMALKLMQTSKYFQHKEFPYFVVKLSLMMGKNFKYSTLRGEKGYVSSLNLIKKPLWITSIISFEKPDISIPEFLTKVAVCDAKALILIDCKLSFYEFQLLTEIASQTLVQLSIMETPILMNGAVINFNTFMSCLTNLQYWEMNRFIPSFVYGSTEEDYYILDETPFLPNLKHVHLYSIDEIFHIRLFAEFMIKNQHTEFILDFLSIFKNPFYKAVDESATKVKEAFKLNPLAVPPQIKYHRYRNT